VKKPSESLAIGVATISVGEAAVAVVVAQVQLGGQSHADIWTNAWLDGALGLAGVGLLLAAVVFLRAVFGREGRQPDDRLLVYSAIATPFLADQIASLENSDLQVLYRNRTVTTPYLVSFSLLSKSREDIRREDFDGGRPLAFDLGTPITGLLDASVPDTKDRAADWYKIDGNSILIGPVLIRPGQSIRLKLLTQDSPDIDCHSNIAGADVMKEEAASGKRWSRSDKRWRAAAAIVALLAASNIATVFLSQRAVSSVAAPPGGNAGCPSAGLTQGTPGGDDPDQPDAIADDGTHVWVANLASNTVTELNTSDGSVVQVLSAKDYGFDAPRAIAVAGAHVWVANADSSTVTELNASDGSLVQIVPSKYFAGPDAIAVSGYDVWITNDGGNGGASVTELNALTGQPVHQPFGNASYHFNQPDAIALDGVHVWVASFCANAVTEMNASDGSVVQVLSGRGFDRPRAIAVAGSHVWVANSSSSTVTELNARDGSLVQIVPSQYFAGPDAIAVSGTNIGVVNGGSIGGASLTELNAQTGSLVRAPIDGSAYQFDLPWALAVDGVHAWIANSGSSTVTEINISDSSLAQILPVQNATATITFPASHASIPTPQELYAAGTVQDLPPGDHLVLFLQWNGQNKYWAGDEDVVAGSNGSWTGTACLGFAGSVKVWLVGLTPAGLRALEQTPLTDWQSGFLRAPDKFAAGITMIASTTITAGGGGHGCQNEKYLPQLY
jgi:DNA-binding beta-propeller fold protein YncE